MPGHSDWLRRILRPWLRKPGLALAAATLVGCGGTRLTTTATLAVPETQRPVTASAPAPAILFVVEGVSMSVEQAARQWAGEAGVTVVLGADEDMAALTGGGLAYVVSAVDARWAGKAEFLEAGVRGVVVEPGSMELLPHLSLLGGDHVRWAEVGFLAGVLAGYIGQAQAVGVLEHTTSDEADDLRTGYEQGVHLSCPRCRVVQGAAADVDLAEFAREGVEGIFVTPGPGATEAARQVAAGGLWVIVYDGSDDTLSERLAGRISAAPESLLGRALQSLADGEVGQSWSYSAESGSLALADLRAEAISPGKQRLAQEAWAMLAGGQLQLLEP